MSRKSETMTIFQSTFIHNPDGREVLIHILNRLGYFSEDEIAIHPSNIAAANWILRCIGITDVDNLSRLASAFADSCPSPIEAEMNEQKEAMRNEI